MKFHSAVSMLVAPGCLILASVWGCGNTKPVEPAPSPTPSSLLVSCDATTLGTIGQQAHCSARLTLSNSTTQDWTGSAQWSSSDSSKVSVSSPGIVTAVAPGNVEISATAEGVTGRQTIAVTIACAFSISPVAVSFGATGGSQAVSVSATPSGCSPSNWTAVASDHGLTFAPATGDGSGSVTVTAAPNTGGAQTLRATVAGQPLTVSLAGVPQPPPMRTLSLVLMQGEQLGGPWEGTVTGPNGYSCSLSFAGSPPCAPLTVRDGTAVDLLVALAPRLKNLGRPVQSSKGCDAWSSSADGPICRVIMNADRTVTIWIGCSIC
jgi:hypothetical protein